MLCFNKGSYMWQKVCAFTEPNMTSLFQKILRLVKEMGGGAISLKFILSLLSGKSKEKD